MGKGYIRIQTKGKKQYATHFIARREGDKSINATQYLGAPIDLENGIFYSRKRGAFYYDIDNGFGKVSQEELDKIDLKNKSLIAPLDSDTPPKANNRSSLEFGNAWLIDAMIRKSGYDKVLNNIIPAETDTLLANILFRLFNRREPISFAYAWYRGSYANILYPDAAFDFPGVANFLSRLGQNAVLDNFFRRHLDYFANTDAPELKSSGYVLVGRADAKNIIKTPRAARENYNISEKNSQKLVCAIDVFSSIPLMFNLFDENVADASALGNAIASLKSYGFNFKRAIVDAGYFSRNNISELYARDIPFIVKLDSSSALYAKIWKNLSQNIRVSKNSLFYGKRSPYGKKDRINLFGRAAYAYAITDFHRKSDPLYNLKLSEHRGKINADRENDLRNYSSFVMLSSANIQLLEALALYRARLKIERAFDIPKNRISSRIPRDHSLERRKGRATINFIAATLRLTLSRLLGESEYDASRALFEMRRLRVNMENGKPHSIEEINKDASAIIQALSLKLPVA